MSRRDIAINEIKTTDDCRRVFERNGCWRRGNGKHEVWSNDHGSCALPHERELRPGTRHQIVKTMLAMGLITLLLAILPVAYYLT